MQEKNVNVDYAKLLEQAFEEIHAIYFKLTLIEMEYRTNKIVRSTFVISHRNVLVKQLLQLQEQIYKIIDAHDDIREIFLAKRPMIAGKYTKGRQKFEQMISMYNKDTTKLPDYLQKQRQKYNKPKKKERPS